ncbi:MAG: hypothetical protein NTY67_04835 [Cyanobacteria bacterium]|nr:hypothetical protein [Cyanobacteriota bacterium]
MARSSKLRVMLSSKCDTDFPVGSERKLSDIRRDLKLELEAITIGGTQMFEVWINEDMPPQVGTWDSWDVCIQAVKDCDILIVLSNGDAGWAKDSGDIGICHAEMITGLGHAPAKVRLIALTPVETKKADEIDRNQRFQVEVSKQSLFRGATVSCEVSLKARVNEALRDAVICLAQAGSKDAARGKFHSGAALDWSRLDFRARRDAMVKVAADAIAARSDSIKSEAGMTIKLQETPVLACIHAIPAAFSVAPARELVGQPFLLDHQKAGHLKEDGGGPIHLILCHKTATETQAAKLLGFPDATIVSTPFGVFVADPVQHVQFVFIKDCRDESTTRHGIQRFFEWLSQTGEEANVVTRSKRRATIVRAIASVQVDATKMDGTHVTTNAVRQTTSKKRATKRPKP